MFFILRYKNIVNSISLDAAPTMKEDSMIELMHMSKEFDLTDLGRRTEDALKENCSLIAS